MSLISRMRKQDAVYWAPGVAGDFGKQTQALPVAIRVRWDDVSEKFIDPKTGSEEISNAIVYVDRVVDLGGHLWLGALPDLPGGPTATPQMVKGAYPIRKTGSSPNLKATEFLRTATL